MTGDVHKILAEDFARRPSAASREDLSRDPFGFARGSSHAAEMRQRFGMAPLPN